MCDNGSTDATRAEFEPRAQAEPLLRYVRIERNRGTPAPARNLGVREARGEWVAFLDDDDRWLPGKLAVQASEMSSADVIATDAIRSSGGAYFGFEGPPRRLGRAEVEHTNPVILSSAVARRSLLLDAHGFDEDPLLAGAEDYELLLRLADEGARFVILPDRTVDYRDHGADRLSTATVSAQRALLRVRLRRWRRAPTDRLVALSALREAYFTARTLARARSS